MQKKISLIFGSKKVDFAELTTDLSETLELPIERKKSALLGNYSIFEGKIPSKIQIRLNDPFEDEDFMEEEFANFPTLIYVNYNQGNWEDMLAHVEKLKDLVEGDLPSVILLKETTQTLADGKVLDEEELIHYP